MGFGKQLERLLNETNMNVNVFSKLIGVRPQRIYNIISRDTKNVNKELAEKIAKAFSVPVDYFYSNASLDSYARKNEIGLAYYNALRKHAHEKNKVDGEFEPLKSKFNNGEQLLFLIFDKLNKDGKNELIKRATELTRLEEYIRDLESMNSDKNSG